MGEAVQRILDRLAQDGDVDEQFQMVLRALNAGRSRDAVELF